MNLDIRVDVGFLDHWKTDTLIIECGAEGVLSLLRLWIFAAQNKPDGRLTGIHTDMIERVAKWRGENGTLLKTLNETRFITQDNDGVWCLHDWQQHNPYAANAEFRKERAQKANAKRWGRENTNEQTSCNNNATSILQGCYEHPTSILQASYNDPPSPSPSPSPSPKKKDTSANADVRPLAVASEPEPTAALPPEPTSEPPPAQPPLRLVSPSCPYQVIVDLYHEVLPELRICRVLNDTRKGYIRQRWASKPGADLAKWRAYFEYVRASPFLLGQKPGRAGRPPFEADLEWLTRPNNYAKVIEGKYLEGAAYG